MRRFLTILLLAICVRASAQEDPKPESAPVVRFEGDEAMIPMDFSAGRPTVQVYLNGMGPYPFVFDTGAPGTVVDTGVIEEVGAETSGEVQVGDPSGRNQVAATRATVDSVRVGGVTIPGMEVTVVPMRGRFQSKFVGVLGFPCFRGELIELDYPNSLIRIRHGHLTKDLDGVVPYRSASGLIEFDVLVDGKAVPFHLDSGSSGGFTVSPDIASNLTWSAKPESVATAKTMNNEYTVRRGTIEGVIQFAGLTFDDPEVAYLELVRGGNVGQTILRALVVTIDQEKELLRFRRTTH